MARREGKQPVDESVFLQLKVKAQVNTHLMSNPPP